jgi:hypothetical protein
MAILSLLRNLSQRARWLMTKTGLFASENSTLSLTTAMADHGAIKKIEFAPTDRIDQHCELADDFAQRVLGLDSVWISDESSLGDFHGEPTNEALNRKIHDVYGVDVSDITNGNLADILERIALHRATHTYGPN